MVGVRGIELCRTTQVSGSGREGELDRHGINSSQLWTLWSGVHVLPVMRGCVMGHSLQLSLAQPFFDGTGTSMRSEKKRVYHVVQCTWSQTSIAVWHRQDMTPLLLLLLMCKHVSKGWVPAFHRSPCWAGTRPGQCYHLHRLLVPAYLTAREEGTASGVLGAFSE